MTSEPDSTVLSGARNVTAATNDPWIFAPLSMGVVFEMKESRVMSLCKTGKLIKTEETNGGSNLMGNVIEIDESGKDGKLTNVQHIQPRPNYASPVQVYEQGARLSEAPAPVPDYLARSGVGYSDLIAKLRSGGMNAYAAGMLVTKDYRILFWQMEDLNTISVTSDGRKWYFLESDLSPADALKNLSYGKGHYGTDSAALTIPLASDVAAICNYPHLSVGATVRYEVDKTTILQFLKSGKRLKLGIRAFREMDGTVGEFGADTLAKLRATNERIGAPLMPYEYVQAKGILVTRNYKLYTWLLHGDKALYLTDFKNHCWLMFTAP